MGIFHVFSIPHAKEYIYIILYYIYYILYILYIYRIHCFLLIKITIKSHLITILPLVPLFFLDLPGKPLTDDGFFSATKVHDLQVRGTFRPRASLLLETNTGYGGGSSQ